MFRNRLSILSHEKVIVNYTFILVYDSIWNHKWILLSIAGEQQVVIFG